VVVGIGSFSLVNSMGLEVFGCGRGGAGGGWISSWGSRWLRGILNEGDVDDHEQQRRSIFVEYYIDNRGFRNKPRITTFNIVLRTFA